MAEEPQEKSKFDVSDLETTSPQTPKAKRKRSEAKLEVVKPAKSSAASGAPLPGVHERPKKARKGAPKSDVEEALDMVREASEAGAWDAKIAEAKEGIEKEEARKAGVKSDVEESLGELRTIEEDRVWEEKISEAKKRADEEEKADTVEIEAEPMSDEEREQLEWDKQIAAAKLREELKAGREMPVSEDLRAAHENLERKSEAEEDAEGYRRLGMKQVAEDASSRLYEARKKREAKEAAANEKVGASGFTDKEEAWFKKGEEDEARQMAEARATIERGGKGELMVENPEDISANIAEAKAMLAKGDLDPREFSLQDYTYLLNERVRIDTELEQAGWWQARKLRKDLEKVMKGGYQAPETQGLDHYEKLKSAVKSGEGAAKLAAKEKAEPERKPSFWERLRMDKGR